MSFENNVKYYPIKMNKSITCRLMIIFFISSVYPIESDWHVRDVLAHNKTCLVASGLAISVIVGLGIWSQWFSKKSNTHSPIVPTDEHGNPIVGFVKPDECRIINFNWGQHAKDTQSFLTQHENDFYMGVAETMKILENLYSTDCQDKSIVEPTAITYLLYQGNPQQLMGIMYTKIETDNFHDKIGYIDLLVLDETLKKDYSQKLTDQTIEALQLYKVPTVFIRDKRKT